MKRGLLNMTPKQHADYIKKYNAEYKWQTPEWMIGFLLGELIFSASRKAMPTLPIHTIRTGNLIQMSYDDITKYNELDEEYTQSLEWNANLPQEQRTELWETEKAFRKAMEAKYLPNPWQWYTPIIIQEWTPQHQRGLHVSLWNCDGCIYEIDSIKYIKSSEEPWMRYDHLEFIL